MPPLRRSRLPQQSKRNAKSINDLIALPGNRYEKLIGDRDSQSSIRINNQYRVCFIWKDNSEYEADVYDYQKSET